MLLSSLTVFSFTAVKNRWPYCWRDHHQVEAFAAITLSTRGSFTVVNLMQCLNAQLRIPLTDWWITIPFNWQKSSANAHCPISSRFFWCQRYWNGTCHIPIKCFEVQDVRPVEGKYHMNETAIWGSIPGELNENVLNFLSAKESVGIKRVCKNAKNAGKSEKGLLFNAIREWLDKIIEECGFESVPNAFKFKVKNCVHLGRALGPVGYVVNTTKRCFQIVQDENLFKVGADIKFGRNMGNVHVCPYIREVAGELRGKWVDARWVAAGIQILMNLWMESISIMIICSESFFINIRSAVHPNPNPSIRSAVQSISLWYSPILASAVPSLMSTFCLMSAGYGCSRVKISWFDALRALQCASF